MGCRLWLRNSVHKLLFASRCWIILCAPFCFQGGEGDGGMRELLKSGSDLICPSITAPIFVKEEMGITVASSSWCYTPLRQDFVGFWKEF